MEYALRVDRPEAVPEGPEISDDPEWAGTLPGGRWAALYFGAEFCEQALPGPREAEELYRAASARGLEPVLLTPVVTAGGLRAVEDLLRTLEARGLRPAVVFNDWGVFRLLRRRFPEHPARAGRLFNRGLRDPRASPGASRGTGSARLRRFLAREGVGALETDVDLGGEYLGQGGDGLGRAVHLPFAFVTSGRNCLLKGEALGRGELSRCLGVPCPRPCRGGPRRVVRGDTTQPLWRAGNTVFQRVSPEGARTYLARADRAVIHPRPMP